jgi:hypothetical protein
MKSLIITQNTLYEQEINSIKKILDEMTDICESSSILDYKKLLALKEFLEGHQNYIIKNVNM